MHQEIQQLLSRKKLESAFNLMVKSYSERLYWHVRRLVHRHDDADDVLQNAFINAWRALPRFRQDSNPYTWLYRIATNEALSHLRKQKDNVRFDDVSYSLSQNLEEDTFFEGDEIQRKLQEAIACLPEKQRVVFNLRYFDEMSYADMSAILETSEGGLKANYHHAVKKIEAFLKDD
jgi:RNA polymerase sigma factor (sigma-70 family)